MLTRSWCLALSILISSAVPALSSPEWTAVQMKKRILQLERENAELRNTIKSLGGGSANLPAGSTLSGRNSAFSDTANSFAAKYISDLKRIGVFDGMGSEFKPNDPITRGEFVSWMVKAANSMFAPGKGVYTRLDEGGTPAFADVPTSHPYYKYIQGLNNTGFLVGYEDKDFRPDQMLTREELIAIKTPFDMQGVPVKNKQFATPVYIHRFWRWDDSGKISSKYCLVFANEHYSTGKNIERVFGNTRLFKPQEPVTRAEAAACIWRFGPKESNTHNQYWPVSAETVAKNGRPVR